MKDFFHSWHFLCDHPCFKDEWGGEWFESSLYIMVLKVNPETESIEECHLHPCDFSHELG